MNWDALIENGFKLLGVLALVLLNAFFVAAEFAFIRLRDTQLEALIVKGHRRAKIARGIVRNVEACVSATQLGITLCGVATGAVVKPVFKAILAPLFDLLRVDSLTVRNTTELIVGFLVSTILLIVVGELVPKAIAIRKTLGTALTVSQPLHLFYRVTYPFIWALNHLASWFLGLLGIKPVSELDHSHSDEELRLLISTAQKQAGATTLGRDIVLNALDLRRRVSREVMRPRHEIVALNTEASMSECLDVAEKSRYSRFPLCEAGDMDRMLGVVHIKDLFAMRLKARSGAELLSVTRKIVYVPEAARLERVLQLLLERKLHMAVVIDEYGGTLGLLTLENILEELVGQIQDEFDQENPMLVRSSETTWEVSGALPLHELEEIVGEPLQVGNLTTANGLVTQKLGGFPKAGDTLVLGQCELRVEEMDCMRVARLRISRKPAGTDEAAGI